MGERPWWHKKRWIAGALLWLLLAWPLSVGPYIYCKERGWVPRRYWASILSIWDPVPSMLGVRRSDIFREEDHTLLWRCWRNYAQPFRNAGIRHRQLETPADAE